MKHNLSVFSAILVILFAISCQQESLLLESEVEAIEQGSIATSATSASFPDGTYELYGSNPVDPLWRFTQTGNSVLLETDPSITSWGTDYWGYWSDPYTIENNAINYTIGLTNTTYAFNPQSNGNIEVIKTLIVSPYLSNADPETTITNTGTYRLLDSGDGGSGDNNGGGGDTGDDGNNDDYNPPSGWETISFEDFENGFSNWQDMGGDASLYTGSRYAHQGSNAANIQDNSGSASSIRQATFDAIPYAQLEISFWYLGVSMEYGENFIVQFDNGADNWVTIADYTRGPDFSNGRFYNPLIILSANNYSFTEQARFRIQCDASNNRDDVFIDEIRVRGYIE